MPKQSDSTSFDLAEYKEFKQFQAMKAEAEAKADKVKVKAEAPKKRGRPAKGTTTAKKVTNEAVFTMLKNGKWVSTGGKGSAHFAKRLASGVIIQCDNGRSRTFWNVKPGTTLTF